MKRNDFETRDNWFQEEKERESKISAWDLDSASLSRMEHEENCEREELAQEHEYRHNRARKLDSLEGRPDVVMKKGGLMGLCFVGLFINWALMFGNHNILPNVINFLLINPGIFLISAITKGKPQNAVAYWVLVLMYEVALLSGNIFRFIVY